jgi:hypothetical protein
MLPRKSRLEEASMTAKLASLAGALTGCALLLPAAHAARGDLVLKTIGNTDILRPTAHCAGGLWRVRVGVQAGTQTVLIGPDVVSVPVVVETGGATFCVHRRGQSSTGGEATATASGSLTLALAAGTIEAAANETQSPAGGGTRSYSSLATIKRGTGRYRGTAGVIVARGTVNPAPDGRQCRKLTFTVEFV